MTRIEQAVYTGGKLADPKAFGRFLRTDARRICIFVREHIGDVVNSTGAIRTIRENCPNAVLAVSVGEKVASTLDHSPDFDLVILRPKSRDLKSKIAYAMNLRRNRFDAGIILDEAGSQARNAQWGGIERLAGVTMPGSEPRFEACVPFDPTAHDSRDQYSNLLNHIGFDNVSDKPSLYPSERDHASAEELLEGLARPIVAVHPGASERTRRWLPERFGEVAAALTARGISVVITGSPAERELCEQVRTASGLELRVLAGDLGILGFAALASRLDAVVVGDTGPMHMAAAMGTPTIVPYGPTLPHLTGPYGDRHRILQGVCGCVKRDWSTCTYDCMRNVEVVRVVAAVEDVLGKFDR